MEKLLKKIQSDVEWEAKTPLKGWAKTKAFIERVLGEYNQLGLISQPSGQKLGNMAEGPTKLEQGLTWD